MKILKGCLFSAYVFILGCGFSSSLSAQPVTNTYVPSSYTTSSGSDNGQPVQNLQNLTAYGMSTSYASVQFQASAATSYQGYRSYFLSSNSQITDIQVLANYKEADTAQQIWTWQIFDWVHSGWVTIGTNAMAINQGPWSVLNFNVGGPCANYVNPQTGELRIGCFSTNSASDALLNYEAVVVTTDSSAPSPGASYFVASTGNDANPGTLNAPWKTISHAAQVVPAGSTVYVRGGVYPQRVVFKVSGNATAGSTTFMSYPGELATIDGTNVKLPSPPGAGPSGLVQLTNVNYLTFQGFEIRNIAASSNFVGGLAIEGKCDHVAIRHNHIHNVSSNHGGGHGLSAYGTASPQGITNLVVDGNELNTLALGQSESLTMNGNVQYWTISNNMIHDSNNIGIDAIGGEGTAPSSYDQARNGEIVGNLVYQINDNNNPTYPPNDNSADGIYIDGGASILVSGNIVHHSNIGIEVASEHKNHNSSDVIVSNNLVFFSTGPGISLGGYNTGSTGGTDHCSVVNNTLFGNDTQKQGNGELQLQHFPSGDSNNIVENNIFYANSEGVLISNVFSSPKVSLNYNLYYVPQGTSPKWNWNNQSYSTFGGYQSASGNDKNSLFADPQFVKTTAPIILYVLSSSPAVGKGMDLGPSIEGTVDVSGHLRVRNSIDMGAYEQ